MKRRNFLAAAATLGAAAWLPAAACPMISPPKYKMGLQLFTIRDDMAKDAIGTLREVKAMGYEDFEVYGFDEVKGEFYGYPAAEFSTVLEDLNLTVSSGHFGFSDYLDKSSDELARFVDQCIEGARALNMNYITWPWMAPEQRTLATYQRLPDLLNTIGEQITAAGLGFAYHNHGFEFEDHDGTTGYDLIVNGTDPTLVKLQIDMYWVMHAGTTTPKELVAAHPGRYVMWHIKDMHPVSRDYTELGNGTIDYTTILPDPTEAGLEFYYLEQGGNYTYNPMRSVADSAEFFKRYVQRYL
ncbi:sugar phosphate isomerase/epimerase [Lewinella aquimaris]|uniref:Sugar phosphate isomerase/epimerase n=1 Tax=Neolewinella aquimaris TaxID=1835722 RepID=A0A840E8N1_9BACT|nr:TIM barrel protein [Neolewinella aquimaris]MBB4079677.1 sugar phosphate isomerase/epimerase [Neolewinella aquimaris]